jgi:carbon starvation protein
MNIALMMLISLFFLIIGYFLYGKYIARLIGIDENNPTPAVKVNDGVDYVPTKPLVLFGHHFAAIAAAGPIVGPTLAVMFGFLPAWLWVILGVVFIGAVHDFSSLFVSIREGGKSVAEVARKTLGKPGFVFYVLFAILLCLLVCAAFLQLTAIALTSTVPPDDVNISPSQTTLHSIEKAGHIEVQVGGVASMSVIIMTLIAPLIGFMIYKKKMNVVFVSILAFVIAFVSVIIGFWYPITLSPKIWMAIILAYVFFASWIPVWIILQPRDFTNAQILYLGIASMVIGIIACGVKGVTIDAPATNISNAEMLPNLGLLWPFLFVTIACGAVSGAHGLVCGGTSSKQISNEKHTPIIGYAGMLLEGVLAMCVILIITGGLGFAKYTEIVYPQGGGSNAPLAFALGLGKILDTGIGIPALYGTIWGILLLEGFLITTIDALTRLTRYLFEELWITLFENPPQFLRSRIFNSLLVILGAGLLSYTNAYLKIWPIFGSANQLLAALTLIAITAWLVQKGKKFWFSAIPAVFMVTTTITSLSMLLPRYFKSGNIILAITDVFLLFLAVGVVVMTVKYFVDYRIGILSGGLKEVVK